MKEKVRQPEARFQAGGVSASIFLNEGKRSDGSIFMTRKTILQRTYLDSEGKYQSTSSFDVNDLPRAILVLIRAYVHSVGMRLASEDSEETGN